MSARIKYAYLKDQTWMFRRNYPEAVALLLGSKALKQSLKTGDLKTAQARAVEVNAVYERQVQGVLQGASLESTGGTAWAYPSKALLTHLRGTLAASGTAAFDQPVAVVVQLDSLCRQYLTRRRKELRPSGFKSVRYSVELFQSHYGSLDVQSLGREQGKEFLSLIGQLSPLLGKSSATYGLSLAKAVAWSQGGTPITARTQRRIWSQVNAFLDWVVYEGRLDQNPFRTVRFDQKLLAVHYAVPTDNEVRALLSVDSSIKTLLTVCLLSGQRSGEAVGMNREDLVNKGNLGRFFHVRPNDQRQLKTAAAERLVPVHSALLPLLERLPDEGALFPELTVNDVTKRFAELRLQLGLERDRLVFHSSRKWFITQCERTGVPEHWTASLVGHASARSENGLTYSIYSSGISDEQRRSIVDQLRLPC